MGRRSYYISQKPRDYPLRSCICTLLVLFVICIMAILATYFFRKKEEIHSEKYIGNEKFKSTSINPKYQEKAKFKTTHKFSREISTDTKSTIDNSIINTGTTKTVPKESSSSKIELGFDKNEKIESATAAITTDTKLTTDNPTTNTGTTRAVATESSSSKIESRFTKNEKIKSTTAAITTDTKLTTDNPTTNTGTTRIVTTEPLSSKIESRFNKNENIKSTTAAITTNSKLTTDNPTTNTGTTRTVTTASSSSKMELEFDKNENIKSTIAAITTDTKLTTDNPTTNTGTTRTVTTEPSSSKIESRFSKNENLKSTTAAITTDTKLTTDYPATNTGTTRTVPTASSPSKMELEFDKNENIKSTIVAITTDTKLTTDNPTTNTGTTRTVPTESSSSKTELEFDKNTEFLTLEQKSPTINNTETCNTPICRTSAARIISSMNFSVNPCENFYDFACSGSFPKKTKKYDIFNSKKIHEESSQFIRKFFNFYSSCVEHKDRTTYKDRIERATHLLESVGKFQLNGINLNTSYDTTELIANLILHESMPLFNFELDVDPDNSTYVLKLLPPKQSLNNLPFWSTLYENKKRCLREIERPSNSWVENLYLNDLYKSYEQCQQNYSNYLNSVEDSLRELGVFANFTNAKVLFNHIQDIRFFIEENILYRFLELPSTPDLEELTLNKTFTATTTSELQSMFSIINWKKLLNIISKKEVKDDTVVHMYLNEYFKYMFDKMYKVSLVKLNNALLAILANNLYKNTVLSVHSHTREHFCKEMTAQLMPDIVNYIYKVLVSDQELNNQKIGISKMFQMFQNDLGKAFHEEQWLDNGTRNLMENKLNGLKVFTLGNDDLNKESKTLEEAYNNINLTLNDYQSNIFNLMEFKNRRLYELLGEFPTPSNIFRHFVNHESEEPVSFYYSDIICIPYGLSKQVTENLPKYVTMAQVGFNLAKEIAKAFDPIGIKYKINIDSDHIDEETMTLYDQFVDDSNNVFLTSNNTSFENQVIRFTVKPNLSAAERLAENAALRMLTNSLYLNGTQTLMPWISDEFSNDKVFFLALAQVFCKDLTLSKFMLEVFESPKLPPQMRIENIFQNSKRFFSTYNCTLGSGMRKSEDSYQFPHIPFDDE